MKRLILYFLLLVAAVFVGIAISDHSGYVLLSYGNTIVETTLWIAVLFGLIGFMVLHELLILGRSLCRLPQKIERLYQQHREFKAQNRFARGLQALLEGNWKKAEKFLAQSLALTRERTPLVNYLAAAYAANKQYSDNQRDAYLATAQTIYDQDKKAQLTISLCRLYLLLQNKQQEEALALISHLRQNFPRYRRLLQKIQSSYL